MTRKILSLILFVAVAITCKAVPACPLPYTINQLDGSVLTLVQHGDEFCNHTTTLDGYTVVQNHDTGMWEYATRDADGALQCTGVVACNSSLRTAQQHAFLATVEKGIKPAITAESRELAAGLKSMTTRAVSKSLLERYDYTNFRGLVILVEYNDQPFSRTDYREVIDSMVNQKGYTGFMSNHMIPTKIDYTGSVRDYYYENSNGKFDPEFDVVGPIKVDYSKYYASQTTYARTLVNAALKAADDQIDYRLYDGDGDHKVDMVYFIFSGAGSNFSVNDQRLIWPHASTVSSLTLDGYSFGRYACSTEFYGREAEAQLDGIGTICHEFSHVLGLPDLYDTDYESTGGTAVNPSKWSVMSQGSYLNSSRTPCGYSLYERYSLNFAQPETITTSGTYTVKPLNESNSGYRLDSSVKDEFFLIESHVKTRWDEYLPGEGMLIYRVDSTSTTPWTNNKVNVDPTHVYYELIRACPRKSSSGSITDSGSDPFPGDSSITAINNFTSPSLRSWSNVATSLVISDITVDDSGAVTFRVSPDTIPTLLEDFEHMPYVSADTTGVEGGFTSWTFKGGACLEVPDEAVGTDFGLVSASTVKNGEIITSQVPGTVESVMMDVYNSASTSAIIRFYYSTDDGNTWRSLTSTEGTGNSTVAGGTRQQLRFNVGAIAKASFRIVQYSGNKTKKCYYDNITFMCQTGTVSGVENVIASSSAMQLALSAVGGVITVNTNQADGTPVSVYSLQGALVAGATVASGRAMITPHAPGVYVVKCGSLAQKVVVK